MLIMIFTVLVIAMTVLVMYKNEKSVLRRMMARGRCGLPGMPNPKFNVPPSPWGDGEGDDDDDDDEKKKIKEKDPFDSQLLTLSKIIVEKRKQVTDNKGRVNKAEEVLRNLHLASVTMRRRYQDIMYNLKEELLSAELECQDLNKHIGKANSLKQKFFSTDDDECDENKALPAPPRRVSVSQQNIAPQCTDDDDDDDDNAGGQSFPCHPPVRRPSNQQYPISCKCPTHSGNPLSTCIPPLPTCGQKKPPTSRCTDRPSANNSSQSVNQNGSSLFSNDCCSPPTYPLPCPAPLPKLLPNVSPECSRMLNLPTPADSETSNSPKETNSATSAQSFNQGSNSRPQGCPSCPPCDCSSGESPRRPPPKYVRRPPFSSFLQERMPSQPIKQRHSFKQTVVTEQHIAGNDGDDEATSWLQPNTIVTEVRTSSVTFPPNCCVSTYEEFLNAALNSQPKPPAVKLPIIVDECDPCAEIPREISPWEDVENVTHTCGTQTKEDQE